MDNNGIIQIKDIHGLKTKYKIVNCLTITKTDKNYLIYTKNSDSDNNIILYISEIKPNKENIELIKVTSENILLDIKDILLDIINKKYNNKFILKNINTKLSFLKLGERSFEISNKLYKILKKDYNSNKDIREIIDYNKHRKEYNIENIKMADNSFIKKIINSDNYINIIKNI